MIRPVGALPLHLLCFLALIDHCLLLSACLFVCCLLYSPLWLYLSAYRNVSQFIDSCVLPRNLTMAAIWGNGGQGGQFPLEQWFYEMPPVTRWWTVATVATSVLVQCHIVTPFQLFYSFRAVYVKSQVSPASVDDGSEANDSSTGGFSRRSSTSGHSV